MENIKILKLEIKTLKSAIKKVKRRIKSEIIPAVGKYGNELHDEDRLDIAFDRIERLTAELETKKAEVKAVKPKPKNKVDKKKQTRKF
jgi:hypothetical protein